MNMIAAATGFVAFVGIFAVIMAAFAVVLSVLVRTPAPWIDPP